MNKNIVPWYFKDWFIILASALWPLYGVPLLVAIILVVIRSRKMKFKDKVFYEKYDNLDEIKEENNKILDEFEVEKNLLKNKYDKEITEKVSKANELIKTKMEEGQQKIDLLSLDVEKLRKQKEEISFYINNNIEESNDIKRMVDFSDNITSNEIKSALQLEKVKEKELIKSNEAIIYLSKDDSKEAKKQSDQLIRAFNTEIDYYLSNVTPRNVDTYRQKIVRSYEILNRLFKIDKVEISMDLLELKLKQLDIIYSYQITLENEREVLKAQKEEIKEQQRVEKELQDAKRKIEKEETQFNNEMKKMMEYMSKTQSDVEKDFYLEKIKDLETKLEVLEKDKENVLERQSNTRAGFVYIISNIGSFGEDIYKIGMTRRLEPMNRIKELGSASVPFGFDVHAIIFSEDAPKLENMLHNKFRENEVNKVNSRKEFFKVNIDEIKKHVYDNFDKTVNFVEKAEAMQYRETLRIEADNLVEV